MAKTYDMSEEFIRYQEEIASSEVYAGMPDLRNEDGSIQWEAPSNRGGGVHKDTHDRRLQWWREKAESVGISTTENQWISKTAKRIHPTKTKPCKFCGRIMDIRYCYLSSTLINRIRLRGYDIQALGLTETTSIFELIPAMYDMYGESVFSFFPALLQCKAVPDITGVAPNVDAWIDWIEREYITREPSPLLGPGAMSNAPDRLDGFHSFNRCCRKSADKGRSKENLASYSTDRRAFEFWSDGNWITANKLMGVINSRPEIRIHTCLHHNDGGVHPRPCSADHIGPISLGFSHRPTFQLLCKPCNSAKNNRLYYSDVKKLIAAEKAGETVTTWYATPIWDRLKNRIQTGDDALRLYRIMRDNRYNAMILLGKLLADGEYLLLYSLLNLEYAEYTYNIDSYDIQNHIVTASFSQVPSTLKYVLIQKMRKVRVAFSALEEYAQKENRNGYSIELPSNTRLYDHLLDTMKPVNAEYAHQKEALVAAIAGGNEVALIDAIRLMPDFNSDPWTAVAKRIMIQIMQNVADTLADLWDDDRYSRELFE